MEAVKQLRKLGFNWSTIAAELGISRQTLYRRLDGSDLLGYDVITDDEVDDILRIYKTTHQNDGEKVIRGHLRNLGLTIPRQRVRASIHRIDPEGVKARARTTIKRRKYQVGAANEVWHMDGNHKLIRWKFVVHGAIDGYSQLIVFLNCASNNRALTVLEGFLSAVYSYGLPQKLRTDRGGENIDAWRFMIEQRGNDKCVIVGSSVHNERIERLWRDVHRAVLSPFKEIFIRLEEEGVLDVNNDVDLFCLHSIFLSRINQCLQEFIGSWNNHPLSTEGHMTPLQLYVTGQPEDGSDLDDSNHDSPQLQDPTEHHVGHVQAERQAILESASEAVEVNNLRFQPCRDILSELNTINEQPSENNGYDLYCRAAISLGEHLRSGQCTECDYL